MLSNKNFKKNLGWSIIRHKLIFKSVILKVGNKTEKIEHITKKLIV